MQCALGANNPVRRIPLTLLLFWSFAMIAAVCLFTSGCAREKPWRDQEQARTLVRASLEYVTAHNEKYPDATRWEEQLKPYLPQGFKFTLDSNPAHRFAMNSVFSRKTMATASQDLSEAVIFFESTASTPSAHDELTSLPRSGETVVLGFKPGHVYAHPIAWVGLLDDPRQRKRFVGR